MSRFAVQGAPAAHSQRTVRFDPTLLACLRAEGADWPAIADLIAAADWGRLLPEAQEQGVAPLLYHRLRAAGHLARLPQNAAWALRKAHDQAWAKNVLYLRTLEQVLGILAAAGIRPLLLKGAGLIPTVYGSLTLRPLRDVDLLVAPEQFRPTLDVLRQAGGRPSHGEPFDGAYELVTHHVGLIFHQEIDVLLELHHQWLSLPVQQAALVSVAELRARAQVVQIGQARAEVLCAEDQVLQLAGHMAIHSPMAERLIWYYDIDQVVRQAGLRLDWEAILQRAQRYGMALPLHLVLPVLARELGTPVPDEVLARLADLPISAAERQRYGDLALGPHSRLGDGLQKLAGLEGAAARLRFAWRIALPSWGYMRENYPDDTPVRLVGRYPARWVEALGEFVRVSRGSR